MKEISQRESTFLKELDELFRRNEALKVSSNGIQGFAVGNTVITKYYLDNAPFSCSTQQEKFDANVSHHWKENANNKPNQTLNLTMSKKKQIDDRKQLLVRYRINEKGCISFIDPCCDEISARLFGKIMEAISNVEKEWNARRENKLSV